MSETHNPTEIVDAEMVSAEEAPWPFTDEEKDSLKKYPDEYREFLTAMFAINQKLSAVFDPLEAKSKQWLLEHPSFDRSKEGDPKNVPPEVLMDYCYPYIFLEDLRKLTEKWRPNQFEKELERKKVTLGAQEHEKFAKYWWQNLRVEIFSSLFAAEQLIPAYIKPLFPDNQDVENAIKALKDSVQVVRDFFEKQGVVFDDPVPIGAEIDLDKVERVGQGIIKAPGIEPELKIDNPNFDSLIIKTKLLASQIYKKGKTLEGGKTFVYHTDVGYIGPDKMRCRLTEAWLYNDRFRQVSAALE